MFLVVFSLLIVCSFTISECVTVKDCGGKSIKVNFFITSPNKVKLGSEITISTNASILRDIDGPVRLKLGLWRKVFGVNVKVPCISNIGSCTFENGCEELEKLVMGKDCPKEILDLGLTCGCPLRRFDFSFKDHKVLLPKIEGIIAKYLSSGTYKMSIILEDSETGDVHLCLNVDADIVS